jgi:integrase
VGERKSLKDEYEALSRYPSVKNWLNALSPSQATKNGALYSLIRYTAHTGKDPEELLEEKEKELKKERRLRYATEDALRAFARDVRGGYAYAAFVKSFFAANHLPLDIKIERPPRKREFNGLPSDERLEWLVNATSTKGMRALVLFLLESGARIGSVLALRYRHLKEDLENGTVPCAVRFPTSITKGSVEYTGFIGELAAGALKDYLRWRSNDRESKDVHGRKQVIRGRPLTDDSFVFESRTGRQLSKTTTISRIQVVAYKAGLNASIKGLKPFHPHVLRQRAQTILEGAGLPLNWVDYLLGHTPRGASASAYSKPAEEQLRESYAKAYQALRLFKPPMVEEKKMREEFVERLLRLEREMESLRKASASAL